MTRATPAQQALAEAARREAALFYGRACGDTSIASRAAARHAELLADEHAVAESNDRIRITRAVLDGAGVYDLMLRFGLLRAEARQYVYGDRGDVA